MVTTRPPKTIVKPTALGPVANTDTKLLIYGLFQKGRVLAQDGEGVRNRDTQNEAGARSLHRLSTSLQQVFGDFNGRTSLQRSPPRWVHPEFRQRAAPFIRALP